MQNVELKRTLILSIALLVALSVSISSYLLFLQQEQSLTHSISAQSNSYVDGQGELIEATINQRLAGINNFAAHLNNYGLANSADVAINQAMILANTLNTPSAMIGFDNGDGYWNLQDSQFPNHKYQGDIRTRPWYKEAKQASRGIITKPYLGTDGQRWVTIASKFNGGVISSDLTLSFLNQLLDASSISASSVALIFDDENQVLASSSSVFKAGDDVTKFAWFAPAIAQAKKHENTSSTYLLNGEEKLLFSHKINLGDHQWYYAVGLSKAEAFEALTTSRNIALMITVLASVISVLIVVSLIQFLYRPIVLLRDTIVGLSNGNGDLTQRLPVNTQDDIGKISAGVNAFMGNLQQMMREVQDVTKELHGNAVNLKHNSQQNHTILQKHVQETEQVATAIEEMDATANAMATDAANTASLTERATSVSHESRQVMARSESTIQALMDEVDIAAADVQQMSQQTQSISKVLGMIEDIAEQTNLLALNAAIEAARAGEYGRGFSVVADEVRALASRTKESTSEIETVIKQLTSGCSKVEQSMAETKQRCANTAEQSEEVANSLAKLIDYVNEINQLSEQIATAAEEQSCVTKEVSANMSAISDMVVKLDASGQQTHNDTISLEQINSKLNAIVGQFKL